MVYMLISCDRFCRCIVWCGLVQIFFAWQISCHQLFVVYSEAGISIFCCWFGILCWKRRGRCWPLNCCFAPLLALFSVVVRCQFFVPIWWRCLLARSCSERCDYRSVGMVINRYRSMSLNRIAFWVRGTGVSSWVELLRYKYSLEFHYSSWYIDLDKLSVASIRMGLQYVATHSRRVIKLPRYHI